MRLATEAMPMSKDPAARARSMANLKTGTGARKGQQVALKNGSRAKQPVGDVEQARLDLQAALADAAPLRDSDDNLPVHDRIAVEVVAAALARYRYMHSHFERLCQNKGRLRYTLIRELRRTEKQLIAELHELGMTPRGRAALGLDVARTAGEMQRVKTPNRDPEHLMRVSRLLYESGALPQVKPEDVINTTEHKEG